ncbi:MAG: hypothetical protein V9H69_21850 [Anaerolineae bacterium]
MRDFDLEISPADNDGRYPVAVLNSPSGQARAAMDFPWKPAELATRLEALEDAVLGGGAAAGQDAHTLWQPALRCPPEPAKRARSTTAAARPWPTAARGCASACGSTRPIWPPCPGSSSSTHAPASILALSRLTPIVRYLELPLGEQTLAVKPPLAHPGPWSPGQPARRRWMWHAEKARLEQAMQPLQAKGQVELVWLEGQSWRSAASGHAGRAMARLSLRRPRGLRPAQR